MFTSPIPFSEAVQSREVRRILPMDLDSAEYKDLAQELLNRSVFSAKVTNGDILQTVHNGVTGILKGATPESEAARAAGEAPLLVDAAQVRVQLKGLLEAISYKPEV